MLRLLFGTAGINGSDENLELGSIASEVIPDGNDGRVGEVINWRVGY
jgi:hypothetical protein